MAKGQENLIPVTKRSKGEAREMSSKGGKRSGESRRLKKSLREMMEVMLTAPVTDPKRAKSLVAMGFDKPDNAAVLTAALFNEAADGNVRAIEKIYAMFETSELDAQRINLELLRLERDTPAPEPDNSNSELIAALDATAAAVWSDDDDRD